MTTKQKSNSAPESDTQGAAVAPTETQKGPGQKSSSERGASTHHKKNPGKRPHQGGGSR